MLLLICYTYYEVVFVRRVRLHAFCGKEVNTMTAFEIIMLMTAVITALTAIAQLWHSVWRERRKEKKRPRK
jgi:hypothetical protein